MNRKRDWILGVATIILSSGLVGCGGTFTNDNQVEITNVSYDPTREMFEEYNEEFAKYWKEQTAQEVTVIQSHGGSGKQARSVMEGNVAEVVTLALAQDIMEIQDAGLIESGWSKEFDYNSAPYTSTIVFLVRKGNEKNIKDWGDLIREDVAVITPNPKSSGGARWNFLAAWAYADNQYDGNKEKIEKFVGDLYRNVSVLDSGARAATTTFVENEQGDVLIAWENEAYLSVEKYPDKFEIITPSISVLAEPPVAVVDKIAQKNGTEEVAKAYLEYLYSDTGQRIVAENYYRPSNQKLLQEYRDVFDLNINLVTIDDFGGWNKANKEFFEDGAAFDQIYSK